MQDSIWFRTLPRELLETLQKSDPLPQSADIAIVGAGIVGICTAYYLTRAGVRGISVLDRGTALGEASGANAGGLWFGQQTPELGPLSALAGASSRLYDELSGEFDFNFRRPGMLQLLSSEEKAVDTRRTVESVRSAGFRVESVEGRHARSMEPGLGFTPHGALFYPDEARLHPGKLAAVLVDWLRQQGIRFCFGVEVGNLAPAIEAGKDRVSAGTTIVASGAWTPLVTQTLGWQPPIKPMRGTLVALEPMPETLHHTLTAEKYYYWQLSEGHLAGGGSIDDVGFERGVDPATVRQIRDEMAKLIPASAQQPQSCAWSGFRPYCEDLKPVIGPIPGEENMFVAAGHFKKGVMMAPVTGKILADLITVGRTELPIDELSPARFPPRNGNRRAS